MRSFRTLDLNLLRVFDEVMSERNLTRAARNLSMTQPAVSNALRRLRDATHEELFIPAPTGVTPTAHAETLWPTVRTALGRLHEAFEPQGFDPRTDKRRFTLAMSDATAGLLVPLLVEMMRREEAQVDLRIVPLTTRDPRPMLEQGQADAAIGYFPEVSADLAADGDAGVLRSALLYRCEYACVMRRDHALARPGALTLDAFCAAEQLRVSYAGRARGFVDEALSRLGRERRVRVTVNQFYTAAAVVQGSDLLTVLPRNYAQTAAFQGPLEVRDLPFELPGIEVSLLWHGRHEQDTAQRWLRELLARAAAQVVARQAPPCLHHSAALA